MKNLKCLLFLLLCLNYGAFSQISRIPGAGQALTAGWVEIYDQPNFQGNKKTYYPATASPEFTNSTRTSIKVAPGYVAIVKSCAEFNPEVTVYGQIPNSNAKGIYQICGVEVQKAKSISVGFNGISSNVHNNDCTKFYGNVTLRVQEKKASDGEMIPGAHINRGHIAAYNGYSALVFSNPPRTVSRLTNYVFNNSPVPVILDPVISPLSRGRQWEQFIVSEKAFNEGRIFILVDTDLGSAHKQSDLATDFTWNEKMNGARSVVINLNDIPTYANAALGRQLVVGPYLTTAGAPEGANIFATGEVGRHNIRVHFRVDTTTPLN